jgi:hypothetical protein
MVETKKRAAWRAALLCVAVVTLSISVTGCAFMRDPLDPRGELDHRAVQDFRDAERTARSRGAFESARQRIGRVQRGMSIAEFEVAMGAIVVAERRSANVGEDEVPRKKLLEGLLCRRATSAVRERWLFGYDEDGVELVGFAVEFERDDPEREKWAVHGVDHNPSDDCPDALDED